MNVNKIVAMSIGLVLGAILFAGLVLPTTNDATDNTITVYNNSTGHFARASSNSIDTIEYVKTTEGQIYKVNGVEVSDIGLESLLITDAFMFKASDTGSNYLTGFNYGRWDNVSEFTLNIGKGKIEGTMLYQDITRTIDESYEYCFYVAPSGGYKAITVPSEDLTLYIPSADEIYAANWTFATNSFFSGNGEHIRYRAYNNLVDADINLHPVDGVKGVYQITMSDSAGDFSFTVDNGGTPYTVHPYYVIVPAKVIGEKITGGFAMSQMLAIIPLLFIIVLVTYSAAFIAKKRA